MSGRDGRRGGGVKQALLQMTVVHVQDAVEEVERSRAVEALVVPLHDEHHRARDARRGGAPTVSGKQRLSPFRTGILLALNYAPAPGEAYDSLRYIMTEVTARFGRDAQVIMGAVIYDEVLDARIIVSAALVIIALGLNARAERQRHAK